MYTSFLRRNPNPNPHVVSITSNVVEENKSSLAVRFSVVVEAMMVLTAPWAHYIPSEVVCANVPLRYCGEQTSNPSKARRVWKRWKNVYNRHTRRNQYPLVYNSVHHIPNGLVAMISACHMISISTSRGRPGFDSLLRSISEMTVLQVQSLPVLANQHRHYLFCFLVLDVTYPRLKSGVNEV